MCKWKTYLRHFFVTKCDSGITQAFFEKVF